MLSNRPIPFLIVADLRTGSTLLSSTLDRHPDIRCLGELFHPTDLPDNQLPGVNRHALSSHMLIGRALETDGVRAAGFRAMVFHPDPGVQPLWADAWEVLRQWPELRVIHLRRRDLLAQYASFRIALETGHFTPSPEDPTLHPENRPRLHISPADLRHWVAERQRLQALRRKQLQGKISMELTYETLTTEWQLQMNYIQRFIGVDVLPLPQAKQKQEQRPLADFILNLDELRTAVTTGSA